MNFKHEYWLPDQGKVLCQSCEAVLMVFSSKRNKWLHLANYRLAPEKRVVLDDGSSSKVFLCKECSNVDIDLETKSKRSEDIAKQYKKAFEKNIALKGENKNDRDMVNKFKSVKILQAIKEKPAKGLRQEQLETVKRFEDKNIIPKKINRKMK